MPNFDAMGFQGTGAYQLSQLANTQAATQYRQAATQKLQMQIQQMEQLRLMMQNAARQGGISPNSVPLQTDPSDATEQLSFMARATAMTGDFKTSGMLLNQASEIATRKSMSNLAQARAAKLQREQAADDLARIADEMEKSNPEVAKQFRKMALTAKERLALDQKEEDDKLNRELKESQKRLADQRAELAKYEMDNMKKGLPRFGKAGGKVAGKVIGEPSMTSIALANSLIKKANPDLGDEEVSQKAYAAAAKARALRIAHPGLDADEALKQAVQGLNMTPGFTYPDGKSYSTALPRPTDGKFEQGKIYQTARGPARFTGSGFEAVQPDPLTDIPDDTSDSEDDSED